MDVAVILAAGEGKRMKSKNSKVMHLLINRPMLSYVIEASSAAGIEKNILLVGMNEQVVKDYFVHKDILYVKQIIGPGIPYGTGYAVKLTVQMIQDEDNVLILTGDTPLIKPETLAALMNYHRAEKNQATVLTALIDDPTGYGHIVRNEQGELEKIVEDKDANEAEKMICEFNSGMFVFHGKELKQALDQLDTNNAQGEMYLTDVIAVLKGQGKKVAAYQIDDVEEVYGINSKVQLSVAEEVLRRRINHQFMEEGVIMKNPNAIMIEKGVRIGRDTVIHQGATILGNTIIGEDCVIEGDSKIINSSLGDKVVVKSSWIEESIVEDGMEIGPYSYLRSKAN